MRRAVQRGDESKGARVVGMGMDCAEGRAPWATLEPGAPAQPSPAPLSGSPPPSLQLL